ncbi:hypothetical protein [Actinoplanes sp. G11-F43]|uniref:hypothetical protein n=1 Tax=Actinoplanes sp. G11-F43 TaxID=3424130 RepID=UPI003D324C2F
MAGRQAVWAGTGRINGVAGVRAALDRVNTAAARRAVTGTLALPLQTGTEAELAGDTTEVLPAVEQLQPLLPWPGGLRRGATIAAVGSTTLLNLLLAGAMRDGSWAAVVGRPDYGALAAGEAGIPLERLALVADPGPDWPAIVAALIDGVAVVVVHHHGPVAEPIARQLQSRARQRGTVLIPTTAWPASDLVLTATGRGWTGLAAGRGRLRSQHLSIHATGRGRAARPRTGDLVWPPPVPEPSQRIPPPAPEPAPVPETPNPLWDDLMPASAPQDPWAPLRQEIGLRR